MNQFPPNHQYINVTFFNLFDFFNYKWKPGGNWFICCKFILFYNISLDNITWSKTLDVLCYQISRRKRSVLKWMLLCRMICNYWNILCVFCRYITMNVTPVLRLFASICIKWRRGGFLYNLEILLMVTIFCGWMKLPLLFSTIILGGPGFSLWTPIEFWVIFRSLVWLIVYKHTIKIGLKYY